MDLSNGQVNNQVANMPNMPVQASAQPVKNSNLLVIVLVVVIFAGLGTGVYYLSLNGNLNFMASQATPTPTVNQVVVQPTIAVSPTQTLEQDMSGISISTDDGELQNLKTDVNGL
jgi:hypothetical protein